MQAHEFFLGPYDTALQPNEILTEVCFPVPEAETVTGFAEFARSPGEFALALAAVMLDIDGRRCTRASIAVGGAVAVPVRARKAESYLEGRELENGAIGRAAELALGEIDVSSDAHGSAEYRRRLAGVIVQRALSAAVDPHVAENGTRA